MIIQSQYYSDSTGETLTVFEDSAIEPQVMWLETHKDAVLIYQRKTNGQTNHSKP